MCRVNIVSKDRDQIFRGLNSEGYVFFMIITIIEGFVL